MIITSEAEARQVLLDEQLQTADVHTLSASGDTVETDAGWAFFNVNGYLGTVTEEGEVTTEPSLVETE
jgi:hypothetical protein